jgi:putative tryptophan/tyrosine transport system substrate-binding protein
LDRRRALAALTALAAPHLLAQPRPRALPQRVRRLSVFFFGTPANSRTRRDAFVKGMEALGYVAGTHVRYDWRYGNGQPDLVQDIARELKREAPDVIAAFSTLCANALKDEGVASPVVMVAVDDPLRAGFVQDLSRPGMNFTGMTTNVIAQAPRLVELLHEAVPRIALIGMLASPPSTTYRLFRSRVEETAARRGLRVIALDAATPQEIERALAALPPDVGGLVVTNDATYYNERRRLAEIAVEQKLPAIYPRFGHVEAGGLMSYGPNEEYIATRAASFVARIFEGDSPADMPIEGPTRYELGLNRRAAAAIDLAIPAALIKKADRVVG